MTYTYKQLAESLGLPGDLETIASASVTQPVDAQAAGGLRVAALGLLMAFQATSQLRSSVLDAYELQLLHSATDDSYLLSATSQRMLSAAAADPAQLRPESTSELRFRLAQGDQILVRLSEQEALSLRLVAASAATMVLQTEVLASALVAPRIWAPLSTWSHSFASDEWLANRLLERAESRDNWSIAVGIGETLRYARPIVRHSSPAAPVFSEAFPAEVSNTVEQLSTRQLKELEGLGASLALRVEESVDELDDLGSDEEDSESGFRPQDVNWQVRFHDTCRSREELAAADALFRLRGIVPHYSRAIADMDRRAFQYARGFMPSWPDDEALRRVGLLQPGAWWGVPQ